MEWRGGGRWKEGMKDEGWVSGAGSGSSALQLGWRVGRGGARVHARRVKSGWSTDSQLTRKRGASQNLPYVLTYCALWMTLQPGVQLYLATAIKSPGASWYVFKLDSDTRPVTDAGRLTLPRCSTAYIIELGSKIGTTRT